MLWNCGLGEDSWESLGLQGDQTGQSLRKSVLNIHWKDWCWSSNNLATWCKELTHWRRPWCWERLKAGEERNDRRWDGWMASLTRWTWLWINSGSWWWTGRPGVLQSMGLQRVGHDWVTELNWTEVLGKNKMREKIPLVWNLIDKEEETSEVGDPECCGKRNYCFWVSPDKMLSIIKLCFGYQESIF